MSYIQLQDELQSQYEVLPNYKVEFGLAYSKAVQQVGDENMENLKRALGAILDEQLQRYIASKATTRGGRWARVGARVLKAVITVFKKKP